MTHYETKHSIGDLVYLATSYEVDREVIKAVKITGLKNKIAYGFATKGPSNYLLAVWSSSDYNWVAQKDVFTDKDLAMKHHEKLKAKRIAENKKTEEADKQRRRNELELELKELEDE